MDSFSSPATSGGSSSALSQEDFMNQLKTQLAQAYAEEFLEIQNVSGHISVEATSSSWALVLETLRCFSTVYQKTSSLSENSVILNFLLSIVSHFQAEPIDKVHSSINRRRNSESGNRSSGTNSLWEVQTTVFTMISEIFLRVGTHLPVNCWQLAVEVFRKIMDALAVKGLLVEDNALAKFYTSLLHCLHLILIDPKGSLSDHVAGLVVALRMFFNYGLTHKSQTALTLADQMKEGDTQSLGTNLTYSGPYRPPHLRKKHVKKLQLVELESTAFRGHKCSSVDHMSSDSDYSSSDGSPLEAFNIQSSKARLAAIVCLQDLCRADPKLVTALWTMLFPSSDVLQLRKFDANLMTCLLFDPCMKVRLTCASTLAAMLDGPVSAFLQMAECKESTKCGSFMALSSSLGQILLQLHTGILHLIKHENHGGLVASLFKILLLLISSTPYSRMPAELLPTAISSLQTTIEDGFLFRIDQGGLLAVAINCLTVALSISPSSPKVNDMLLAELSTRFSEYPRGSGVLSTLFHYSEPAVSPTISIEALQALRAVAHNYPNIMTLCWERVSSMVSQFLDLSSSQVHLWPSNNNAAEFSAAIDEKTITAAVKVLDECLRAITGFKGTEDLFNDKLLESPFTSDYIKIKTISSAPLYGSEGEGPALLTEPPKMESSGIRQWCITIDRHMPLVLQHTSSMVRTASVTCFAGITSSLFISLPKDKQDFIFTSCINAALNDEVPMVRSAACRAIGVIARFPHVSQNAGIVGKFISAAEINTHSPSASVRIAASWAIANICDSLRYCLREFTSTTSFIETKGSSELIPSLIECALLLTTDGDKIKANAVRALGNLARVVHFASQSVANNGLVDSTSLSLVTNSYAEHLSSNSFQQPSLGNPCWIERMVQAFLSCVTNGNVKVQWNVCHALSNLFLNETLKLRDMDWAPSIFSILLLMLRDSPNFKIKIHAAAALAVPASILDYGISFTDVVQSVEQKLEHLNIEQISTPSSFRYRIALEKQLTSTMLHLLGFVSRSDHQALYNFLVKKSSFLEDWLRVLCLSLGEACRTEVEHGSPRTLKKEVLCKALQSLIAVFEGSNQNELAQRFVKLQNKM